MTMVVLDQLAAASIAEAVAGLKAQVPESHLLALIPEAESANVGLLQAACREAGMALAGAMFPQLVHGDRLVGRGAVLLQVTGAPPPRLIENIAEAEAPVRIADAVAEYVEGNLGAADEAALFCIFDALVPNIASHLDAWYLRLADRVGYAGVNAGNERFAPAPCLFDGERFVDKAVLLQLLPGHPGASLEHGYGIPENGITATAAEGNCIVQIDWRPALDVYRDLIARQYGVALDRENFYTHAVHFPFGILRADGEVLVRIPVALGDAGEIVCVGEIPPYSILTLLDARAATGRTAAALARQMDARGAGCDGGDLLLFYCAGRRMHMGEGVGSELAEVARETGARRVAGALSLGEIGGSRSGGYPLFHNATLVGVPWPNP